MFGQSLTPHHLFSPISLDYFSWGAALALFASLAIPIIWLGARSLTGKAPPRKCVAITLRLCVLAIAVLIIGGARWNRPLDDLEVLILHDASRSTDLVQHLPQPTLDASIDAWIKAASATDQKPAADGLGIIRFARSAQIESMPSRFLNAGNAAILDNTSRDSTNVADAVQLAMSTMSGEALHRIVLLWDGNQTAGDLDRAASAAAARHIPIDIMPLEYQIDHEVILERLDAPSMKREGEPFSVRVILRSTNSAPIQGKLSLRDRGRPLDMDLRTPGMQPTKPVTLAPGVNIVAIEIEPSESGVRDFEASFEADDPRTDAIAANNSARAFTFVHGRGNVLYVDNVANAGGRLLADALEHEHIAVHTHRIAPSDFPHTLAELQSYDAIILANVPRGIGGLDEQQDQLLATYVHDLGGGVIMIGGPDSFGAGGWTGSKLEEVLPVDCSIPAKRVLPAGLLILVLDHSGSMAEGVRGSTANKQFIANQSAVLAVRALSEQDLVGVIQFDAAADWVVPVRPNTGQWATIDAIKRITPAGGTMIPAGLELACEAVEKVGPEQAAVKHVLLMTDGQSEGSGYEELVARLTKAGASLSTVGIGDDVNPQLLSKLAQLGKGRYYPVSDPTTLPQIFIKEARTIRRTLIQERPFTPGVLHTDSPLITGLATLPPLRGIVLTTAKSNPNVTIPLVGPNGDPLLAHWQAGLGRAIAFTSDATNIWAPAWVASESFDKFWAQAVRWAIRPPVSTDFQVIVDHSQNGRAKVTVLADDKSGAAMNFLSIAGQVVGPDLGGKDLRLAQTGPGRYEGDMPVGEEGNYVGLLRYRGPSGESGTLPIGTTVEASAELRVLASDNSAMLHIANMTGGRILRPWDPAAARLFTREGLTPETLSLPTWDRMMILMIALFLVDVGARRIAWGREDLSRATAATAAWVRSFTTVRKGDARPTLEAYRRIRDRVAAGTTPKDPKEETPTTPTASAAPVTKWTPLITTPHPNPKPPATKPTPDHEAENSTGLSGLKAAKRRAQERFDAEDDSAT